MAIKTKIEWTNATWNVVTGCDPVSTACDHCYARRMATRLAGRCGYPKRHPFDVVLHPRRLAEPLHWRTPRRVFVCSMGDLFHEDVPDTFLEAVFAHMSFAGQHTFQVLTKRPDRAAKWFARTSLSRCQAEVAANPAMYPHRDEFKLRDLSAINGTRRGLGDGNYWPLPNVWIGTTVENQTAADVRIPALLKIPATARFLSCEPLLGPLDMSAYFGGPYIGLPGDVVIPNHNEGIHWVIAGGESGQQARPMHPDWVRSLRDQCQAAGVRFFFKQWGEWLPFPENRYSPPGAPDNSPVCLVKPDGRVIRPYCWEDRPGHQMARVGKCLAGRLLDGREWNELPASYGESHEP